jgi:VanZ family protein
MGIIFYFSSLEGADLPSLPLYSDKVIHFAIYIFLAFLASLSFRKSGVKRYVFLLSFSFTVLYGITDEIHQLYVPDRDVAIADIIANSAGALSGSYLAKKTFN